MIFIAYRYTGEPLAELTADLTAVTNILRQNERELFCSLEHQRDYLERGWGEDRAGYEARAAHCIKRLRESTHMLALVRSPRPSEGFDNEIAEAQMLNIPIIAAQKNGIILPQTLTHPEIILHYSNRGDLVRQIDLYFP